MNGLGETANSAHGHQMMSATECLAKAHGVLNRAAGEPDPRIRLDWEYLAQEWGMLAIRAEIQEILQRELLDLSSN